MRSMHRLSLLRTSEFLAIALLLTWPGLSWAQTVVATIPNAGVARVVAVNPVTNKIYVANCNMHIDPFSVVASITAIDGATNSATSLPGACPAALAVNTMTNKIYFPGGVIDGATNSVTPLPGGGLPANVSAIAVNPVTNKIYVGGHGNLTVIDGATNSATTVTDPNANGLYSASIAVNSVTNKIYVANGAVSTNPGNVTVIDGATNTTTTVTDPNAIFPQSVAVNSATNKIYVANGGDYPGLNHGNITVIDGTTNAFTTLTDPNALAPRAVAVNQSTNKIYVANANDSALNGNGGVTIIDGATNAISFVSDQNGSFPNAVAVDSGTNTIYVTNDGCYPPADPCSNPGFVTVINGATNSVTTLINPNAFHPAAVAANAQTGKTYAAGSGNVTVIDDSARATSHILLVALAGIGSGTVTSTPAGVDCGASCTATFATGTLVNLTASPASGSRLSGWSAACTGTNACNLTMASDEFVTATFGPASDFSLQPASASLTTQRGGQVTDVITIAPVSGSSFDSPIQLTCGVANPTIVSPTCALSPSSVMPGASSVNSTLTITASAQSTRLMPSGQGQLPRPLCAVFLPMTLVFIGFVLASGKSNQRKRQVWLLCSLFLAFVAWQGGCGGGNAQTQPQNYIVVVTGTSGAITHATQLAVTIR